MSSIAHEATNTSLSLEVSGALEQPLTCGTNGLVEYHHLVGERYHVSIFYTTTSKATCVQLACLVF